MSSESLPIQFPKIEDAGDARKFIDDVENQMYGMPERQVTLETKHHFAKGIYARELFIPKGTLLTGKIHLGEYLNIVSKGDISVMTEHGMMRIQAPYTIISKPGTKRMGYAHEDTVWTTIHATNETDLEKLEKELVVSTHEQYLEFINERKSLCHGSP